MPTDSACKNIFVMCITLTLAAHDFDDDLVQINVTCDRLKVVVVVFVVAALQRIQEKLTNAARPSPYSNLHMDPRDVRFESTKSR